MQVTIGATTDGVSISAGDVVIRSPEEGIWSVATDWKDSWPTQWEHARGSRVTRVGDWHLVTGNLDLSGGRLELSDAYRVEGNVVRCVRRFHWSGKEPLKRTTLSVRWIVSGATNAKPLLPGISYSGNPSGAKMGGCVPIQKMVSGEESYYEEHRFPMPFVCLEWENKGAALHAIPSMPLGANHADQWWSLGLTSHKNSTELALLSGPCASNGQRGAVKARQGTFMPYPDTWLDIPPGSTIEKTFFLQPYSVERKGNGFVKPMGASLDLFQPYGLDGLPTFESIIEAKSRFALSRWRASGGFEMYPDYVQGTHFVMGWCGQAEALAYAMLVQKDLMPEAVDKAVSTLNLLSTSPFNERGFHNRYTVETKSWTEQDFVSQGQAMESITRAIQLGHKQKLATKSWEEFMRRAATFHSQRILNPAWRPLSTNEGFLISPLLRAARLFRDDTYSKAALKAADHYASRHVSMDEPYWGGTLDASCEDKEGAWAAFQGFLAAYDHTKQPKYLEWAEHAMNVALTYTVVWDIELPAGRLKDHGFKSRGWTVVSAQNQHLDVFGVYYTPEIYRMGALLKRPELQKLARVMFRSCGQLIDPFGSQGEQIQQTNFAQAGDMSNVYKMRGGYSEGWTVFWITAHFLHAAARFKEMGVQL